ncbi:MAG: hypothetical protein ACJA2F_001426 [Nitriliruptoraceae bacterium]|jgi:hypothetical protein
MTQRVGVLVHGGDASLLDALVGAVATADGLGEVRAIEVADGLAEVEVACRRLAEVCEVVIGLAHAPWPGWALQHSVAQNALGELPYWAVETWHGLPALHDHLVAVVGDRWQDGTRVLVTAPDIALRALPPEQRVVLRDVAEALHQRTGVRPTIAVDRSPGDGAVTPTAATAVTTLAEAHGATAVARVSLAPQDGPDPDVSNAAFTTGVTLSDVTIDSAAHVRLLLDAVATMIATALAAPQDAPDSVA